MIRRMTACVLTAILIISSLVSCGKGSEAEYDKYVKVADNLYEVTCDEYDCDYLLNDGFGNYEFVMGGCSAIKEGSFLGRNFDYIVGDAAEIVVRTTPKDGRYASVGMAGGLLWLSDDFMENGLDEDAKKLIPLIILDGINEKGLAVEINCVNAADAGGMTMHTNPGKKEIAELCTVRYLLDNAADADEAIEIMMNIDIVNSRNAMALKTLGFEVHFLITDKDKTYVVEFDNTKPDGEKMIVLEDEKVMTNFYLHLADPENGVYSDNSMGVERYRKLSDNRDSINSMSSMKELMQSIRFTNSNRLDGEYAPGDENDNPYTCFSDHPVFGDEPVNFANHREHIDEIKDTMKRDGEKIAEVLADPDLTNPDLLWCTSHSSVYDLENRTLSVAVFERFKSYYDYSVSGK